MPAVRILCPGRRAKDPLLEAADIYADRLTHYTKFELKRLKESDPAGEAAAMLSYLAPDEHVIALDERGLLLTTEAWMGRIQEANLRGIKRYSFLIGGADGLGAAARARAQETWSLSPLTLPHRFALAMLLEQLYRVHTIMRGEKYHRA